MQRLEITGETPEALYFNVVKTLLIFLRGAQTTGPAQPQEKTEPAVAAPEQIKQVEGSIPSGTDQKQEVIPPKTRGKAKKDTEPKILNDEMPDLSEGAGCTGNTIEHRQLTLDDDIRPRLRAIQQAATKRGLDMPATISYIQKLYGPFGIAKAEQLKPEQFAEFMEASDGYLSGEA